MCARELRRRLHEVDPDLHIVSGAAHRRGHPGEHQWLAAAGAVCRQCGREYFRGRDGLCYDCWEKEHEIEVRDTAGALNFFSMDIIKQITHKARKDQTD